MISWDKAFEIYLIALKGYLIIGGTFILTRNLFESSVKRLVNFLSNYERIPLLVRLVLVISGYKIALRNIEFWDIQRCPSSDDFPWRLQVEIIEPFIGFLFIAAGTILSLI
jgi:hypothetical protein